MTNEHGPNRAKLRQSPEPNLPRDTAGTTRPERLWLWPECHDDGMDKAVSFPDQLYPSGSTEYIRADLTTPAPVMPVEGLEDYDAGLLNDFGGGNVEWWQDYLRAEIGRANDFWRDQVSALRSAPPVGARVTGWQPIETAPKDGVTEVLMYDPGLGMAVWPSTNSPWPNVTHWMPLPEPPAALRTAPPVSDRVTWIDIVDQQPPKDQPFLARNPGFAAFIAEWSETDQEYLTLEGADGWLAIYFSHWLPIPDLPAALLPAGEGE